MNLGVSTGALRKIVDDNHFEELLNTAADLPVDHVEILFARPKMLYAHISDATVAKLRKKKITLHGPFFPDEGYDPFMNDEQVLQELEKKALLLGALHVTVHPDLVPELSLLDKRKVHFAIENVKSIPSADFLRILDEHKTVGFAFDPNHSLEDLEVYRKASSRIVEVHLSTKGIDVLAGQVPQIPKWALTPHTLIVFETHFKQLPELRDTLIAVKNIKEFS